MTYEHALCEASLIVARLAGLEPEKRAFALAHILRYADGVDQFQFSQPFRDLDPSDNERECHFLAFPDPALPPLPEYFMYLARDARHHIAHELATKERMPLYYKRDRSTCLGDMRAFHWALKPPVVAALDSMRKASEALDADILKLVEKEPQ